VHSLGASVTAVYCLSLFLGASIKFMGLLGASVRRDGVMVVTRRRCRWSMVKKSWEEEAVGM
jgi:hypothetical protein